MSHPGPELSLRERTRRAVRADIAGHALELFTRNGFDATTIGEIAKAAGISERSFFRYFATKEDVVIGDPEPYGLLLQAALAACPTDRGPWDALREAFGVLLDTMHEAPVMSRQASALMVATPALRARHLEKQLRWEELLVPNIAPRLGNDNTNRTMRAHALVAAALSCLDAALNQWSSNGNQRPVEDLLDDAIAAVRT